MNKNKLTVEQLELEIEKIARYIAEAKIEIIAIAPPESDPVADADQIAGEKNIAGAAIQLNEVVRHTEEATNAIMDKADAIVTIARALADEEAAAKLNEHAFSILESCSFQDITGQRIKKVMTTLEQIELRVARLLKLFGGELPETLNIKPINPGNHRSDEDLCNGPQLAQSKPSQDDIDKLFSSL